MFLANLLYFFYKYSLLLYLVFYCTLYFSMFYHCISKSNTSLMLKKLTCNKFASEHYLIFNSKKSLAIKHGNGNLVNANITCNYVCYISSFISVIVLVLYRSIARIS